jgi:transcriptional regulator with XRE-family HTH domain
VRTLAAYFIRSPSFLRMLRRLKGQSLGDVAKAAGVDEEDVEQHEAGALNITLKSLTQIAKTFIVPPEDVDEDYVYEPDNPNRKGGKAAKKKYRDRWYGDRPEEYKGWWHITIKPYLVPYDPDDYGKNDHDEWEQEWRKLGCPRPEELWRPLG